jgi:hypothetical protein
MQQSAVPWLTAIELENRTGADLRDLVVAVEVVGFALPREVSMALVPSGATLAVPPPDLHLSAAAFVAATERQRADLVVTVRHGGAVLAHEPQPIDVLAYNEWPGLAVMPSLLAAFVSPNHPSLAPLLRAVGERLFAATGDSSLDGRGAAPPRARAMVRAIYDVLAGLGIGYVLPPPSFERAGQKVRTPEQVVGDRLGTCLDLTLLVAALCEHVGLPPLLVLLREHAFVAVWLGGELPSDVEFGPAVALRKRVDLGLLVPLETTAACGAVPAGFDAAVAAAQKRLADDAAFVTAIDVAAARRAGVLPLPARV